MTDDNDQDRMVTINDPDQPGYHVHMGENGSVAEWENGRTVITPPPGMKAVVTQVDERNIDIAFEALGPDDDESARESVAFIVTETGAVQEAGE